VTPSFLLAPQPLAAAKFKPSIRVARHGGVCGQPKQRHDLLIARQATLGLRASRRRSMQPQHQCRTLVATRALLILPISDNQAWKASQQAESWPCSCRMLLSQSVGGAHTLTCFGAATSDSRNISRSSSLRASKTLNCEHCIPPSTHSRHPPCSHK